MPHATDSHMACPLEPGHSQLLKGQVWAVRRQGLQQAACLLRPGLTSVLRHTTACLPWSSANTCIDSTRTHLPEGCEDTATLSQRMPPGSLAKASRLSRPGL